MKLENYGIKYHINEEQKIVVAIATYKVRDNSNFPFKVIHAKGIARAKNEKFNRDKGKKLARARAEREIFCEYRKHIDREINRLNNELSMCYDAKEKNTKNLEHQKEYIKTFLKWNFTMVK